MMGAIHSSSSSSCKETVAPPQQSSHRMLSRPLILIMMGGAAGLLIESSMVRLMKSTIKTNVKMAISSNKCRPSETGGYIRYEKIIGHLHMPKTAGTDINGELAARYERICGHKGYSYDAYQFNKRMEAKAVSLEKADNVMETRDGGPDLISQRYRDYNRGRVHPTIMKEIGYEDCDYVSLEDKWETWIDIAKVWPLEIHVPCRDPLEHLMSQCNHVKEEFDCSSSNLIEQINKCLVAERRFSVRLEHVPNITMKCFNAVPVEPYLEYIDQFLQRKRLETTYIHRRTNNHRDREHECIWNNETAANTVLKILLSRNRYFRWCDSCMGTPNDLLSLP